MRLRFIYQPADDLETAEAFYRDELGFEEAWREGPSTMAFKVPGTEVQMLLDVDPSDPGSGPFFVVESVAEFYESNRARLQFLEPPKAIPPGMFARFTDPSGNVIRIMDDTTSREH
jgi:catechol 2,3-dioxygenase-like lactoylglutathione lyase family enzyme